MAYFLENSSIALEVRRLSREFSLTGEKIKKAFPRAVYRTLIHFRHLLSKDIAREIRANLAVVKARLRVSGVRKGASSKAAGTLVCFTYDMPAVIAGRARDDGRTGVSVGATRYRRGFLREIRNPRFGKSRMKILERKSRARMPVDEKKIEMISRVNERLEGMDHDVGDYLMRQMRREFEAYSKYVK